MLPSEKTQIRVVWETEIHTLLFRCVMTFGEQVRENLGAEYPHVITNLLKHIVSGYYYVRTSLREEIN